MIRVLPLSALCVLLILTAGWGLRPGPPMICDRVECGDVTNLPPDKPGKGEAEKLLASLPSFLKESTSILAHMEALRRAAIVLQGHADAEMKLLAALACRALNTEASGKGDAAAWFDLAFFIGCQNQIGRLDDDGVIDTEEGVRGFGYMKKALVLAPDSGEMQYGAALMMHPAMRSRDHAMPANPGLGKDVYDQHLRKAASMAGPGSMLEKNLRTHITRWGGNYDAVKRAG